MNEKMADCHRGVRRLRRTLRAVRGAGQTEREARKHSSPQRTALAACAFAGPFFFSLVEPRIEVEG